MALSGAERQKRYRERVTALVKGEPRDVRARLDSWIDEALAAALAVSCRDESVPSWAVADVDTLRSRLAATAHPAAELEQVLVKAAELAAGDEQVTLTRALQIVRAAMLLP